MHASAPSTPPPAATPGSSPNVAVSGDLTKQCQLDFAHVEEAPKFQYNDADLLPADRDLLQQVAQCLVTGPMKGRSVKLVGRADPRGTDEYNLGLGTRRASSVLEYLQRLGVPAAHLTETTRGAIDAVGTDESSWQRDRRVDVDLAN